MHADSYHAGDFDCHDGELLRNTTPIIIIIIFIIYHYFYYFCFIFIFIIYMIYLYIYIPSIAMLPAACPPLLPPSCL